MSGLRVSLVVPCYNGAPYLAEALASAFEQDPAPDEVIFVDDGSTDDSGSIAASFDSRVHHVRQDQQGISAARNRGITLSTGDLIAFLDADDIWPAGSLSARRTVLEDRPELDCASGLVRSFISPELPDEIRRRLVCPEGLSGARVAGAMLVRRRVFDLIGRFDPSFRIGETLDWVARADAAGVTNQVVEHVVLHRRVHAANTTVRLRDEKAEYLRVLKASLDRRRASVAADSRPGKD
jgi:glycosyltransferase involved in cell wall biosynthesis